MNSCMSNVSGPCKKGVFSLLILAVATSYLAFGCNDDTPTQPEPTPTVLAIVDVMTLNHYEAVPTGFTGVAKNTCTDPFVPDVIGNWTDPSDVNEGIRGDTKFIWVKYKELPVDSDVPVLVDIEVEHWPSWIPIYPEGWEPAGPLTTGTLTSCWRNGLNVKYLPLRETDTYISTLCLSFNTSPSTNSCPDSACACGENWPREIDDFDTHAHCGDDYYVVLSYYRPMVSRCAEAR
jgi:hypothetical protein